jgi:hypothetical protein
VGELKKGFARNYGQHQFRYVSAISNIVYNNILIIY